MIIINDSVENISTNLNIWIKRSAIKTVFQGIKYKTAIWSAGNCLIILRSVTLNTSELEYDQFRYTLPDQNFCEAWNTIAEILSEAYNVTIPSLDPFWVRLTQEELFIEAISLPETNPLPSEAEWKEREREAYRSTAEELANEISAMTGQEVTTADILEHHIERMWKERCERIERAKAIIQARKASVDVTSAEGAERYWNDLQRVQELSESIQSRGGRPRNRNDDWAWEQVNQHEQELKTIFLEWKRRNQEQGRDLVDEERSFRHAIDPRRYERRKLRKRE